MCARMHTHTHTHAHSNKDSMLLITKVLHAHSKVLNSNHEFFPPIVTLPNITTAVSRAPRPTQTHLKWKPDYCFAFKNCMLVKMSYFQDQMIFNGGKI